MATLPAPDAPIVGLMAEKVDDIILVQVDQIDVGERLRAIDPVWADALGAVMAREGQKTPIELCRLPGRSRWTLVAGAHRVRGAGLHDIVYLKAIEVTADKADRRLREISENLWRRDLDPMDRAAFLAELVMLKRTAAGLDVVSQRDARVSERFKDRIDAEATEHLETISTCYGWSDEIGAQIGLTGRSVRNDLMIYRGIAASAITALRGHRHPVATNGTQLRALAKLDHAMQGRVVALLVHETFPAKNVADALARLRGSNSAGDPAQKRFSTILSTLRRMSVSERTGLFQSLVFHALIPAEARRLIAPMLRDSDQETSDATGHPHQNLDRDAAGLAGHGGAAGTRRADPIGKHRQGVSDGGGFGLDAVAVGSDAARSGERLDRLAEAVAPPSVLSDAGGDA